ncbi:MULTISPECIES: DUF397 domain-containing protein [Actinomycetes]|uniref:DUF397 domain-containing protein n=1 Tax=Actinomycetes TaxID=1760 RepID=UPI0033C000D2
MTSTSATPPPLTWVKSTYSAGEGQCVEWPPSTPPSAVKSCSATARPRAPRT